MSSDPPFIHPTAEVDPAAVLGDGCMVWNWSKVCAEASLGPDSKIGQGVYVDRGVEIGSGCKIQNGVSVYRGVSVGDNVFIGPNATLTNDKVPRADSDEWAIVPTSIEEGVSIGANATVLCGITLGRRCMVAAGALVTRDVPPFALVMGAPARVVDYVTVSGRRLGVDPTQGPPPETTMNS